MTDFRPKVTGNQPPPTVPALTDMQISEPRCHVCQHGQRHAIDRLIAIGTSYSEIDRIFEVSRKSVASHADKHLNYEDAAIREIVMREAEKVQANIETGVTGVINDRLYLEVALQKALDALLSGTTIVEPKDAVAIIQLKQKLDGDHAGAITESYQLQFNIIVQAVVETSPPELWQKIQERAQELWIDAKKRNPDLKQIDRVA